MTYLLNRCAHGDNLSLSIYIYLYDINYIALALDLFLVWIAIDPFLSLFVLCWVLLGVCRRSLWAGFSGDASGRRRELLCSGGVHRQCQRRGNSQGNTIDPPNTRRVLLWLSSWFLLSSWLGTLCFCSTLPVFVFFCLKGSAYIVDHNGFYVANRFLSSNWLGTCVVFQFNRCLCFLC